MDLSALMQWATKGFEIGISKFQILFVWLVVVALIFIPLERLWYLRRQPMLREGLRDDLALYFLGGLIPPLFGLFVTAACIAASLWLLPASYFAWLTSWPLYISVPFAILAGEICYYWAHRLSHEIPWLWRFHSLHHSPTEMDWLVNTRAHPLDLVFGHVISGAPLLLLGIKQPDSAAAAKWLFAAVIFNVFWAFFVHSNIRVRLGWFEHVLTTPAFHHWHHANDSPEVTNKNYSAVLPWVDRLFGTHHLPDRHPAVYGTPDQLPQGIFALLAYPFRRRT